MSSGRSSAYNESIERRSFEWFAGAAAVATAVVALAYALTFVIWGRSGVNDFLLLAGALLSLPVFVGLYRRFTDGDGGWALLALVLAAAGAYGAAAHAGQDLADRINPPAIDLEGANPTDPRGLATFGLTGLAVILFSVLIRRSGALPARLGLLGFALGALPLLVYLARLIVLDDDDVLVRAPAALAGVIASPLWYFWLGRELMRAR